MIINSKKAKNTFITLLILTLVALGIFLFIKYGIALRQLEKQEIAEQIEKLGYYRPDFHINAEREILEHKYGLLIGIPMLITLMITLPLLFIKIFEIFSKKNES